MSGKSVDVLNELIETDKDAQEGFETAAEYVENSDLKSLFHNLAHERAGFAAELMQCVRSLGGDPETSGSTAGAFHRAWMDIKGSLPRKSDHSILNEVERGEDSALKAYEEALKQPLAASLADIVNRQYRTIKSDHDKIKRLRDAKAASTKR